MRRYLTPFLIGGVAVPVVLHLVAAGRMPWWPDTVTLGVAFGLTAVLIVVTTKADWAANRRLWDALRNRKR